MNNIYKVIWSKAKNCYVVASEIARSHTKSATGSEKIGGVTRRSLLASLMALSLLCGGLGVASAVDVVHVNESATGTAEVYTKAGVDTLLKDKADKTALDGKADKGEVNTNKAAIQTLETGKANTSLNNLDEAGKSVIKTMMTDELEKKADATNVYTKDEVNTAVANVETKLANKADKATTLTGYGITDAYTRDATDTAITTKVNEEKNARELKDAELRGRIDTLSNTVDSKVSKTDLNTTLGNYYTQAETDAAIKTAVDDEKNARDTAIKGEVTERNKAISDAIALEVTNRDVAITKAKTELQEKVTAEETARKEEDAKLEGKITENTTAINNEKAEREAADIALSDRIGTVDADGKYIKKSGTNNVSENLKVLDTQAKTNADNIQTNANNIKNNKDEIARVNGELVKTNNYFNTELSKTNDYFNTELGKTNNHFNTELGKTNAALQEEGKVRANADAALASDITATNKRTAGIGRTDTGVEADNQTVIEGTVHFDQKGNVSGVKDLKTDTIHATGEIISKGLDAGDGDIKTNGKVSAGDVSTGTLETTGKATIGGDLTVDGKLNVGEIYMEHKKQESTGEEYDSATSITADGISNNAKVTDRNGVTTESKFTHDKEGSTTYAKKGDDADWKEATSNVTADGVENIAKDSKGNNNTFTQTSTDTKNTLTDKEGNTSTTRQDSKGIYGYAKDKDGNKSYTKQEGNRIAESVIGQDGKETKSEMTSTDITNTAKDGTITNDAKDIVNNATGDMTNNVGGNLSTTVGGNEIHEVKGTKTETVEGKVTENFKNGQETNVTGNQDIHVTGKQTNTVGGGQENIISGGQTNTITGGQINNITGDQTTTITGNKTETVTEDMTEDYKKNLTTTVGGNEIHEVKGTKTETVEGKLTENFKGGQETNVTGDQTTNVSGTQTTTATDINRNASSGMIDTIDNDYGTNTETKVAGKTTTDVSIKGTGEEGKYIRGANESRDYLIKGTLKNSETKTVEATSTEITDGNGKTSATIQDVNNLAGSVTNGTETGVSGIHANNDGSVSIDSAVTDVTDGNKYSVINQKKGSIQSTVVDGTNSTVILQDKDNVTIASSKGMVGLVGKDIVNNAQETITNTAGTSITNQVNNSKVTTDANGTTFENNTPAVSDGGATTTKINGNQITTGRVDANELGVSDKDGDNTADFSVKAGEGVKASAGNGTTTGSLDVKADEVVSSVKDADGKGSTFKQRIDAIMMESKDVSITAEETLTNEAKVITNRASEVINNEAININNTAKGIITSKASEIKNQADKLISNKVGENTWENMENGKITTSIKDGAKQNLTQSDAEKTEHSVVNGSNSTVNKQTSEEITDAVTNGTTTNVTQNTATSSNNTIADKNGNANTVISTVDGTSFINSKAAAPVTGASGAGTAVNTTIKGNTITTGKVTMDYAQVMRDLGVNGNANIDGKTTTGSLEVKGESKLTGNVTMENNATVGNDLTVKGITTTKTLKVTENAEIDGNATIKGDVTANSYKVGDKTYIDANGINANNQKITNVADGSISEGSKDAVNGGQLYNVKNDLEGKVNKVGANAAAMANLHPMEFDPDSKWNIAAAMGNYGSETATAIGAFYRPNEDVMVNFSTAFGTGENMVGGGVSVRLGKGSNKLSREESNALKAQVNDLTARMDALLSVLNPNMSKDFPDVPENHWAYEAVSRLAGNDIVQGYPDGEFHGERTMTRYEMAEIIYNALSRGAEAEKELVEEFKPELQAMAASEKATAERAEG